MTENRPHSVSVAGIVVNGEDKVLVIRRRDNGHWEPPGGILELDETFQEGVRREVHEETGIWVKVERLTGIYKNMKRGIVALVFRCAAEGGVTTSTNESSEVKWMDLERVKQSMAPAYAIRVEDAFGADVQIRVHDGLDLRA
ncbi:MAG TPA: NUDIX domain-containing protein [Pseudonocardiaceae bacterium]|nr:NUDIX domain-containing protein [Pseudonocardiaceae bacterium]